MHSSSYGGWSRISDSNLSRSWSWNIPNTTSGLSLPSHIRASHLFSWEGSIKLHSHHQPLSCIQHFPSVIVFLVKFLCWYVTLWTCLFYFCSFGLVLVSRAIRAAQGLTSIQVNCLSWINGICIWIHCPIGWKFVSSSHISVFWNHNFSLIH